MEYIKNLSISEEVKIGNQNIYLNAGICASFQHKGGEVFIESKGDIHLEILKKETNEGICRIKRKGSRNSILSELKEIGVSNDKELELLLNGYNEDFDCIVWDSPWWEITFKYNDIIYDLEWVADSFLLVEAIEEAYNNIDDFLKNKEGIKIEK